MRPSVRLALTTCLVAGLSACAANLAGQETLSRYDQLQDAERGLMPVREFGSEDGLGAIRAVYMDRAAVADGVIADSGLDDERFARVVDRLTGTMCRRLARGGVTVTTDPSVATHRLDMTITGFRPTNAAAAGASSVIGVFVPGPLNPRIPVGVGALAVEGELLDLDGEQIAAMQWNAQNHLVSGGGAFTLLRGDFGVTSDGEDLASAFADSFGDLIVDGRDAAGGVRGETERGVCTALARDEVEDEVAD
jgi:hypothetical protein